VANAREVKRRIKSVDNTRQITRTMELVATSKLKRATDRVYAAEPYAAALQEIVTSLYSPGLAERFPVLRRPEERGRAAILLLTANRGLAGAFNANLIREARQALEYLRDEGVRTDLFDLLVDVDGSTPGWPHRCRSVAFGDAWDGLDRIECVAIGDVRGHGLFVGLDWVSDRETKTPDPKGAIRVVNRLQEKGFLTSNAGALFKRAADRDDRCGC